MPNPTEFQPQTTGDNLLMLDNDKQSNFSLGLILSRSALAPKVLTVVGAGTVPNTKYNIWLVSNSLILPTANYWGDNRSPIVLVRNTSAGIVTITANAGDQIENAVSYNLPANTSAILFTDGSTNWYLK